MDWRGGAARRCINDGRRCSRRVFRNDVIINHGNGTGREHGCRTIEETRSGKKWGKAFFSSFFRSKRSSAFVSATWVGRFFFFSFPLPGFFFFFVLLTLLQEWYGTQ